MGDVDTPPRRLRGFTGRGYEKGRSWVWQAAWFATQNVLFGAWWLPARFRPVLLRVFGARIGPGVLIRHRVRVLWPWKLTVGEDTWIGEGAWLLNLEHITIGANVCISQEAYVCTGSHDHRSVTFEYENGPITIADGAWIATQALVLRGVDIGRGALVGARSIVSRSVPDGARIPAGTRH